MNFISALSFPPSLVVVLVVIPWVGVWALGPACPFRGRHSLCGPGRLLSWDWLCRVVVWARSPVPVPDSHHGGAAVELALDEVQPHRQPEAARGGCSIRMVLEVLLFRSLFRNTKLEFRPGPKIGYEWEKWLWLAALAFHYSFLVVVIRHLRFFTEPIPWFVQLMEYLDGFMQVGIAPFYGFMTPSVMMSGFVLLGAVTFLVLRRIFIPQVSLHLSPGGLLPPVPDHARSPSPGSSCDMSSRWTL